MALSIKKKGRRIIVKGTTSSSVEITDKIVTVNSIVWVVPTTVGHLAAVKDKDGDEVIDMYCVVANQSQQADSLDMPIEGLYVADLDSGYLIFNQSGLGV